MATMDGRQLTRSRTNRKIAGVAGGIAEYFGIDPILVRVAFVVATFFGFAGVLLYVVLWIVMPEGELGTVPVPGIFARSSPALRIAEDRFARGEITAQELAQIREDLMERA
jgi:phage shock protein C